MACFRRSGLVGRRETAWSERQANVPKRPSVRASGQVCRSPRNSSPNYGNSPRSWESMIRRSRALAFSDREPPSTIIQLLS